MHCAVRCASLMLHAYIEDRRANQMRRKDTYSYRLEVRKFVGSYFDLGCQPLRNLSFTIGICRESMQEWGNLVFGTALIDASDLNFVIVTLPGLKHATLFAFTSLMGIHPRSHDMNNSN